MTGENFEPLTGTGETSDTQTSETRITRAFSRLTRTHHRKVSDSRGGVGMDINIHRRRIYNEGHIGGEEDQQRKWTRWGRYARTD